MDDEIGQQSSSVLTDKRAPRNSVELQKLLIDERIRCETHKTNYQTLKEEHTRLQDELMRCQEELTGLHRDKICVAKEQEKKDELIQGLKRRLEMKHQELEVTKTQVVDPGKLEAIKGEISRELEEPLKDYMMQMDKEVEKYRTDYNKMRYQYTILKTENDHMEQKFQRQLEEQNLSHQTEVSALKYERDDLQAQLKQQQPEGREKELMQMRKVRTHLEQRVRALEEELEEERKVKESRCREASDAQHCQAQELVKLESNLKSMEMEKHSVELQCERLRKELTSSYERIQTLTHDVQETSKQNSFLKGELEENEHREKLADASNKMEILKMKGDYQRENDSLANRLKTVETELELARGTLEQREKELEQQEESFQSRIQDEIKLEWEKNNMLTNEKSVLEQKVQDFERRFAEERIFHKEKADKLVEEAKRSEAEAQAARRESDKLRERARDEEHRCAAMQRDVEAAQRVRDTLVERDAEVKNLTNARKPLLDELDKARCAVTRMRAEMDQLTGQADRERCEFKTVIEKTQKWSLDEVNELKKQLCENQNAITKLERTNQSLKDQHKKVKASCLKKLRSLNNDLEIRTAEKERLEVEVKAGAHGVSNEEHQRLKRKLRDLERKHREFQRAINHRADDNRCDAPTAGFTINKMASLDRCAAAAADAGSSGSSLFVAPLKPSPPPKHKTSSCGALPPAKRRSAIERKSESSCAAAAVPKLARVEASASSCGGAETSNDEEIAQLMRKISAFCSTSSKHQEQARDKISMYSPTNEEPPVQASDNACQTQQHQSKCQLTQTPPVEVPPPPPEPQRSAAQCQTEIATEDSLSLGEVVKPRLTVISSPVTSPDDLDDDEPGHIPDIKTTESKRSVKPKKSKKNCAPTTSRSKTAAKSRSRAANNCNARPSKASVRSKQAARNKSSHYMTCASYSTSYSDCD